MKIKGMLDIMTYDRRTQEHKVVSGENLVFNDCRHKVIQGWTNSYWSTNVGLANTGFGYGVVYLSTSSSVPDRDSHGSIEAGIYSQTSSLSATMTKIDDFTYDFLYTSGAMTLSSGSYTLRVVGLRINTPYGYSTACTAMQIPDPITHNVDVYVYVYYRIRLQLDPDDYCYNILDCANITSQSQGYSSIGSYRKFWTLWGCGYNGSTSTFLGSNSNAKGISAAYIIAKGNPCTLAGLYPASNTSMALCTNGYKQSISRVFAHLFQLDATPTYNNYLYYNTNSLDIPESYGTLTLDADDVDSDEIYIPFSVRVNYANDSGSGSVGDISYNLDYWYMQSGATFPGSSLYHMYNNLAPYYETDGNWQMSTSCNRQYTCVHISGLDHSVSVSTFNVDNHKGVYRSWTLNSWAYKPNEQTLCMMNDGTIFWAIGTSTLCRFSKIDNRTVTMLAADIDTYDLSVDFSGVTVYHMFSDMLDGGSGADLNVVWILTSAGLIKMTEWTSATPEYEIYTTSTPNFGETLTTADFVPRRDAGLWSFQARNGAVGWVTNANQNKIVYWDSKISVSATTYTESTSWSTVNIGDFAVSADGTYVAYTNRNSTVQNKMRIRQPLSAWSLKYDYTFSGIQTVRLGAELNMIYVRTCNYANYNRSNYSYVYNIEIDLINWVQKALGYGYYASSAYPWKFGDRAMTPGGMAIQGYYYVTGGGNYLISISGQASGIYGIHYGWNGSEWVQNHSGSRVTHGDARYIPHNVSIAFNDAGGTYRSFRVEDYYAFCIHPSGWIVDNLQALTIYDTLYCWCTHFETEEAHTIPATSPYTVGVDANTDARFYSIDSSAYSQGFKVVLASDPTIVFTRKYRWTPTSTTSVTMNTGSHTWTIDRNNIAYNIGDTVYVYYNTYGGSTYMYGTVTSYVGYTLTINITYSSSSSGSTFANWLFTTQWEVGGTYCYRIDSADERSGTITFYSADAGKDVLIDYMWLGYEY